MERRSSEVNASSPFSAIISSSAIRWESSWLCSGGVCSPMLIVRPNERRRSSLANPAQSRLRPCLAPAFAKALLKPVCQSRMVPPVSNVRALTSSKVNAKVHLPGVVRAHYMVLCFGFLRRKARRLGGNWCKFAQPRPLSGLRYSPTEGSPFTLCGGPFLSMPPNPPKSQSEAYSSK